MVGALYEQSEREAPLCVRGRICGLFGWCALYRVCMRAEEPTLLRIRKRAPTVDDAVRVLRELPENVQAAAARAIIEYGAGVR